MQFYRETTEHCYCEQDLLAVPKPANKGVQGLPNTVTRTCAPRSIDTPLHWFEQASWIFSAIQTTSHSFGDCLQLPHALPAS